MAAIAALPPGWSPETHTSPPIQERLKARLGFLSTDSREKAPISSAPIGPWIFCFLARSRYFPNKNHASVGADLDSIACLHAGATENAPGHDNLIYRFCVDWLADKFEPLEIVVSPVSLRLDHRFQGFDRERIASS